MLPPEIHSFDLLRVPYVIAVSDLLVASIKTSHAVSHKTASSRLLLKRHEIPTGRTEVATLRLDGTAMCAGLNFGPAGLWFTLWPPR